MKKYWSWPLAADRAFRHFRVRQTGKNSTGGTVGPDLSSIGATKEKRYLIDSVLEPSKDMAQGFIPMRITLNSGKVLLGAILSQSADGFELAMSDGNRAQNAASSS